MMPISDRELCALRTEAEAAMTDTCTVMRPTEARGSAGGITKTYALQGTLKCRVRSGAGVGTGAREQVLAARLSGVAIFTVSVPVGSDVRDDDRLVWQGRTLEVHGVLAGTNATAWPCVCSEVS